MTYLRGSRMAYRQLRFGGHRFDVKGSPAVTGLREAEEREASALPTELTLSPPESPSAVRQLPPTGATRGAASFPASLVSRLRVHLPGLVLLVVFFVLPGLAEWIADVLTELMP
jgi:hypothetical protein